MTGKTAFETRFGFARNEVLLGNWRESPFSRWSFQNVGELVPSARVAAASSSREAPAQDIDGLLGEMVALTGGAETVAAFLTRSDTDALTIMKAGKIVGDWFAPHMEFGARHIIFSISKSLTAILAGILEGEGVFDPQAPVTRYLPESAGSAYGDASVRHVLDMSVSLDFEEAYLDPESAFARYRRATLWNPGGGRESLADFILTLQRLDEPHGRTFRYRSPNSDLLGILLERASGQRLAEWMHEKLWLPLGAMSEASVTVDMAGTARTAGGISVTPRDLARIGEMMRQGGIANGRRIVPEAWVRDTVSTGGDAEAWQRGTMAFLFPQGRYRNKWYQIGAASGAFCGIGIHGQWLYVDPKAEVVIAKMSSQPEPVDEPLDVDMVAFFEALSRMI
ncbi:MAG: class C beta-lactamase-related serine hydrolase [Mesorhizobium sp.]|uniref:serine hydrolase domain-containing protein n=1 Tax=Mesorhizobium sp. TaxID=1871066 RepID=UPI000FE332DC|nr:serine hydrolase [Mesorhizobium sp.]RWB06439.1 MAG: class C beta-lactamase-related serine hydrolase [Mesorhizobium sp.]RWB95882.1 MAG: class C beta-lactamase-related serine hydrolase [Mesorhizobium sp.]RWO06828.1 MAG: class C beta-lactamase-related serine hydrolase [Mesorhizobium sp.]RWP04308.1 MAG: class C beta-lactamase-related serine hydrolase [Mesorhizobium sp.]RWP66467.1 MAG: class C beta-lactamase-related serine hydrolase [Mesorhizobium sp.]